jgi:3',5'-cyclic AMP phosphodiesterase CpdA
MSIFTLPKNGEAGGVNSGTEQYYSFDYANVHFICLDSQVSARNSSKRAAMKTWLQDDLNTSTADWKIVFFHHPPYSKGSHNSDGASGIDQPMTDMRVEFTPLFDDHGVDLVFSGHSHSYERSYYIGGHTGLSSTFNASQHAEVNSAGQPLNGKGDQAYSQITNNGTDDKVVYTVAGSSGKISGGSLNHPAHASSQNVLASVVLDITQNKLEAKTLGVNGNVLDSYTIDR